MFAFGKRRFKLAIVIARYLPTEKAKSPTVGAFGQKYLSTSVMYDLSLASAAAEQDDDEDDNPAAAGASESTEPAEPAKPAAFAASVSVTAAVAA